MTIYRNAVHCNVCDTTIESFSVHDFKGCMCSEESETRVFVDGGHSYNRRMFGDHCDYTEITEEFVPQGPVTLEHSDVVLNNVHHAGQCAGERCTIHNRSNHARRSWVQRWDARKGMRRISPVTGRSYKDPDEL